MDNLGWVKLHRKILDSRVFLNKGLLKLWIYCLCRANHKKNWVGISTGRGEAEVEVLPGQFIFGRKTVAEELEMSPSTLYDRMQKLKGMKNINIQSNSHYSIVSICNWETYQQGENKKQQASNRQATGKQQASNTDNNDKNDKNDKKSPISFDQFWDLYDKKIGKKKSKKKWKALSETDQKKVMEFIPKYKSYQPDSEYRKNPLTFFNNRSWEDEYIQKEFERGNTSGESKMNWGL
jgi:hypothetical protein